MTETTILIATRNRPEDIVFTISSLYPLLDKGFKLLVYDDASSKRVEDLDMANHNNITFYRSNTPVGYLKARNFLMRKVISPFAVILDDDAHFILPNSIEILERHFKTYENCGAIAFRVFWGLQPPTDLSSNEEIERVKSYIGCGHAIRMKAWKEIPEYPEWYIFYGEEEFASIFLFKLGWEVHYLPEVLVQHRVDNKSRREKKDYELRMRRSLSAGWFNYFLFAPRNILVRRITYSALQFVRRKILKGKLRNINSFLFSIGDIFQNIKEIKKNRTPLTTKEFLEYESLGKIKIYWNPQIKRSERSFKIPDR